MDTVLDQLAAAGLEIQAPLEFAKLKRCKADGDRGGKQSGWYVLHEMRLDNGETAIVGSYGNWKRYGSETLKIEFDRPSLSPAERQRLEAEQKRLREQAAEEKRQRAEHAASRAHRIWQKLPVEGRSEYLQRKKVAAYGVRFSRGSIVVPIYNGTGLVGLQFIPPDGQNKKFLTGTPIEGAWFLLGADQDSARVWIAEGYATAASVHMATGEPVFVAFNAGNLPPVARYVRQKTPERDIVVVADNDRYTVYPESHARAGEAWNPGIEFARKAAAAVGAHMVVPDFEAVQEEGGTDFNDLHVALGIKAAREQLLAGAAGPVAEPAAHEPDDSPPPSGNVLELPVLNLERALLRFALAMPDGKVWDAHKKQLLKKTAARDLMGKKLFDQWVNAEGRRTVDQYIVKPMAAAAAATGGGGLAKAINRFVYLYPSTDAWDRDKRLRVPLAALRHAIADCFDDWLKSGSRVEIDVENLVFDPTQRACPKSHINTFRGLPLEPHADDSKCQAICELVSHLCNGKSDVIWWLYRWLAYPLQRVGAKMATAVLMHSSMQGSGKSLFFEEAVKAIYGEYGSTLGQHQLESQYTDWRSQLLFALFEEIFSRDQKYSHTGTLKHMITGKTQRIEKKFVSGWEEANFMNAVFLSNEIQPFPLETTDRRMLVIWPKRKMSDDLKKQVKAELANGGVEAFYAFLLRIPLGDFNTHTEPPMTEEKERLIDFGRPAWEVFYREWRDGYLDVPYAPCLSEQLFTVYRRWCDKRLEHKVSLTKFGGFLAAQDGLARRRDVHYHEGQTQRKGTFFVPREPVDGWAQGADENLGKWLGRCQDQFGRMLKPDPE